MLAFEYFLALIRTPSLVLVVVVLFVALFPLSFSILSSSMPHFSSPIFFLNLLPHLTFSKKDETSFSLRTWG